MAAMDGPLYCKWSSPTENQLMVEINRDTDMLSLKHSTMHVHEVTYVYVHNPDYCETDCSIVDMLNCCTVFIHIKARLKYTQGLKYTPGSAAE